jgi:hypothetical protein
MPEDEYLAGLSTCKLNLHGRIIWPKGSTPLKVGDVKAKLSPLWKTLGKWGLTSLGKGFYKFSFSSLEDVQSVRSVGSWNLNHGFLKLFTWTKDFNPNIQQNSNAQVWIRIYGLAQEYWRPKILFAIVSSVGTPICTDQLTNKPRFDREFGHFARVLVDVDLKKEPIYRVLVERIGFAFFVDIDFENRPSFCHLCNCIGHDQNHCKRFNTDNKKFEEEHPQVQPQRKKYVAKPISKETTTDSVVEVINLVEQANPKPVDDPLLESILKNKEIPRQILTDDLPLADFHKSPATTHQFVARADDDLSSTAYEFVDATQLAHEDSDGNEQTVAGCPSYSPTNDTQPTPDRIANDMQFLHTSWANLAKQDDIFVDLGGNNLDTTLAVSDSIPIENQFEFLNN